MTLLGMSWVAQSKRVFAQVKLRASRAVSSFDIINLFCSLVEPNGKGAAALLTLGIVHASEQMT